MIRYKQGVCAECNDDIVKVIIAKRCGYHYKIAMSKRSEERRKERAEKQGIDLNEEKIKMDEWFAFHMKHSARICENCGKDLRSLNEKEWRGSQHHVLEKSLFPSVKFNRFNHLILGFYCCHPIVSNLPSDIVNMNVFKKAKQIVKELRPNIIFSEIRRIPDYFED